MPGCTAAATASRRYDFECVGAFTHTTPTDAYRGAGRPEATYAIERAVDALARKLGKDPVELRRANFIKEFPAELASGLTVDSGDYDASLDRALEMLGYEDVRREQAERRERGDREQLGIGFSTYMEMCGLAPSRILGAIRYVAGGWDAATIRCLPTGTVQAIVGTSPHGQGHGTTFAQIAADRLGMPVEDIEVLYSDTAIAPLGMDSYGSRSLAVGGVALYHAADKIVAKAKRIVAHSLEVSENDLEYEGGRFTIRGTDRSMTVKEAAFAAWTAHNLPDGMEPGLEESHVYDPPNFSWPAGCHIAIVAIDTETGAVDLRRYIAVDDVGTAINPMIVDGQVQGGIAQGVAQALLEEAVYDEDGNLVTGSMTNYLLPSAAELLDFELDRTESPSPTNPLGVKGVGETGAIASTAAVMNAVVDALTQFGVTNLDMPATPERVWRAIEGGEMIPARFDYEVAGSVDEAVELLGSRDDAKLLAGGHSLLPLMKLRFARPELIVDIGRLSDLSYVHDDGDRVAIGALTRHHDVANDAVLQASCGLVSHTAGLIGDPQVRHRGTIGGSVAHGDPASDLPAVLLALDAELVVRGPGGERTVAAGQFFHGLFQTALGEQDVLTEIRVPKLDGAGWAYEKFNRRAQDWATVGRGRGQAERLGSGRADEHGLDAGARERGRGGARLRVRRGGRRGACRRGHEPAQRHVRERGVPEASRERAGPASPGGGRSRLVP